MTVLFPSSHTWDLHLLLKAFANHSTYLQPTHPPTIPCFISKFFFKKKNFNLQRKRRGDEFLFSIDSWFGLVSLLGLWLTRSRWTWSSSFTIDSLWFEMVRRSSSERKCKYVYTYKTINPLSNSFHSPFLITPIIICRWIRLSEMGLWDWRS